LFLEHGLSEEVNAAMDSINLQAGALDLKIADMLCSLKPVIFAVFPHAVRR
jgi:hypothetical protein